MKRTTTNSFKMIFLSENPRMNNSTGKLLTIFTTCSISRIITDQRLNTKSTLSKDKLIFT